MCLESVEAKRDTLWCGNARLHHRHSDRLGQRPKSSPQRSRDFAHRRSKTLRAFVRRDRPAVGILFSLCVLATRAWRVIGRNSAPWINLPTLRPSAYSCNVPSLNSASTNNHLVESLRAQEGRSKFGAALYVETSLSRPLNGITVRTRSSGRIKSSLRRRPSLGSDRVVRQDIRVRNYVALILNDQPYWQMCRISREPILLLLIGQVLARRSAPQRKSNTRKCPPAFL